MIFIHLNKTNIYVEEEEIIYKKDKETKNGTSYYRCSEKGCLCRGKVINGTFKSTNDMVHLHRLHSMDAMFKVKLNELKQQVMCQTKPIREIYRLFLREMSFDMAGKFSWNIIRNGLQKIRRQQMPPCTDLKSLIELLENNEFVKLNYGKIRSSNFYQGTLNNNIMVFANLEIIEKLPQEISIYVDATFKVCPFNTKQLLLVLTEAAGAPRPIIFGLMTGKEQKMYEAFFHFIKHAIFVQGNKNRIPSSIMVDFEKGLRNAAKKIFPNIKLQGCNFHHVQALRRRAKKTEGLSTKIMYKSQHHFILFMRISLLPIRRINNGFIQLINYIATMPDIEVDFQEFIEYYETTWFERYKKQDWCVSNAFRRTNNNIEGINSYIKKLIPRHPSPYIFLDRLLDLSYETSSSFSSASNTGFKPKDRSKLTKTLNIPLQKLNNNEISELDFLKILARI